MILQSLALTDFRNFINEKVDFGSGINIIEGDNAQGKTNLLESVYFCATGRTARTRIDKDLIRIGEHEAHCRAEVLSNGRTDRIDLHIGKDGKTASINGVARQKLSDLFGVLIAVLFSPEDLGLIKEGPSERRRFMDLEICQFSRLYYTELAGYYRILKQRNSLLKSNHPKDSLFIWDEQLVHHGLRVIKHRREFISRLSELATVIHTELTGGIERFDIIYKPNVTAEDFPGKLQASVDRDLFLGMTTVGIHKDDLLFRINGQDAKVFASQGQQRTAVLSLKLSELALIEEEKLEPPVLLLDDVLSELDRSRQECLMERAMSAQTIITCTGAEAPIKGIIGKRFTVKGGKIII